MMGPQWLPRALIVLAFAFRGDAAWSQQPAAEAPVPTGAKVRILAPQVSPQRILGTVFETGVESLVVGTEAQHRLTVPWRAITRLEVSTGRRSHARQGLLIGAAAGVALSVVLPKCVNEGCTSEVGFDPTFALVYGLGGGLWGALVGAMVKTDAWSAVPLRVAVSPTPGHGVRLAVSFGVR